MLKTSRVLNVLFISEKEVFSISSFFFFLLAPTSFLQELHEKEVGLNTH